MTAIVSCFKCHLVGMIPTSRGFSPLNSPLGPSSLIISINTCGGEARPRKRVDCSCVFMTSNGAVIVAEIVADIPPAQKLIIWLVLLLPFLEEAVIDGLVEIIASFACIVVNNNAVTTTE